MPFSISNCKVCTRRTNAFNYGVICCNSCKMFFKRATESPKVPTCKSGTFLCYTGPSILNPSCRACRFQKCHSSGMRINEKNAIPPPKFASEIDGVSRLIKELSIQNSKRYVKFLEYHVPGEKALEYAFREPIKFKKRPENYKVSFFDWGVIEQLTTIDFMKKLEFVRVLEPLDQIRYVRGAYFGLSVFLHAMRNYSSNRDSFGYPDPDVQFPAEIHSSEYFTKAFLIRVKSRLVGKIIELQLTQDEFLLVSVLLFCCPDVPNLSENAKTILTNYRNTYASYLLQHCQVQYQVSGPARFTDLLSLSTVIKSAVKDISEFFLLYRMFIAGPHWTVFYDKMLENVSNS